MTTNVNMISQKTSQDPNLKQVCKFLAAYECIPAVFCTCCPPVSNLAMSHREISSLYIISCVIMPCNFVRFCYVCYVTHFQRRVLTPMRCVQVRVRQHSAHKLITTFVRDWTPVRLRNELKRIFLKELVRSPCACHPLITSVHP